VHPRDITMFDAGPQVIGIDTRTAGLEGFNSVYLVRASEPALVEAASAADAPALVASLGELGIGPDDLAHIVVTHVHLDHAGGAGDLLLAFPRATLWAHERGAPHLVDPGRLEASTARIYGEARMRSLYGHTRPASPDRLRSVTEGDRIGLGDRDLIVVHTPGHASHHIALHDDVTDMMFTGEAIGSHLPWADVYRPALPPPEVDVEAALSSIQTIRARRPARLLTSHFGIVEDAERGCDRSASRVRSWSTAVRTSLEENPDLAEDELVGRLTELAGREYRADAGVPIDLERYDAIGSIRMNAQGLARYWRKRWESEERAERTAPSA
jgi:glyoxylase-like metal-dependent hydrolase (beta-lactamase superfamily II)